MIYTIYIFLIIALFTSCKTSVSNETASNVITTASVIVDTIVARSQQQTRPSLLHLIL